MGLFSKIPRVAIRAGTLPLRIGARAVGRNVRSGIDMAAGVHDAAVGGFMSGFGVSGKSPGGGKRRKR